ncbi:PDZ domain-containing protein [Accumulibacter sp.]|uniref:M61 family metallopeptidase n=1 Tax=Accumulibacter sp. TaxID=2053492 RepID=UPI0025E418B9|nr:PDZ domain-containing protein [Accumulibacter sp.]MCM8627007.1 PDZ domain-containing protein [Accumulibacter sp.]
MRICRQHHVAACLMKSASVRYRIVPSKLAAHRLEVRCTVDNPDEAGQRFALPAWIPGSYLIRDFARHIVSIRAECAGKHVPLVKIDKHTWQAPPLASGAALSVVSEVYAADLSVRGAHVDPTHAFFNGTSVFLRVVGREGSACLVDLRRPVGKEYENWRVATTLPPADGESGAARQNGFGLYRAADYEELIDHPVEMGTFTLAGFPTCGVVHEVAITGRHDCDVERLTADLRRLCEWQIRFFGEPAPMSRYLFLVTAVGDAYGGLEHRASSALICARDDLPYLGMRGLPERYRGFLGLCSHEYFHTWNVKRIRPQAFASYNLDVENYTSLLWAFEGFTSYYDELALLRCGLIPAKEWLSGLARTIDRVHREPGRQRQTLAEASFDAWTKFYRPDENTPNTSVSYYAKGALVALALDLTLRAGTAGRVSLDDVMRALWLRHGAPEDMRGVGDDDIRLIAEELSGLDLEAFFADAVHGTSDIDLARLLRPFGIRLKRSPSSRAPSLGIRTASEGNELRLTTVYDGGAAQSAGLSANDLLVAVNGLRVTPASLERLLGRHRAGDEFTVHVFRRDELMDFTVRLAAPPRDCHRLMIATKSNPLRRGWLYGTDCPSPD